MRTIPLSVAALLAGATTCALLGGYVMFAMIGKVNKKLPDGDQISYLWGHYAKEHRVLQEYKHLYPEGRLDSIFLGLVALMFLLGIAGMVLAVYASA